MSVKNHVITSGIVSSILYLATNSPAGLVSSFLAGVLTDADHILDYYLNMGPTFNIKKIYAAIESHGLNKIYIFLHSFELLVLLWLLVFLIPLNTAFFAAAIGLTQHLLLDQIGNPVTARAYFLAYRRAHAFKKEYVLNINKIRQCQEY